MFLFLDFVPVDESRPSLLDDFNLSFTNPRHQELIGDANFCCRFFCCKVILKIHLVPLVRNFVVDGSIHRWIIYNPLEHSSSTTKGDSMVNIIFEGPDHAGKSTLARAVAEALHMPYQRSIGVPKTFEEVLERANHYLNNINGYIIDRHPCVSQPIYGQLRDDPPMPQSLITRFYDQNPVLVYCCAGIYLQAHKPSPNDTPEHLEALKAKFDFICFEYERWATDCAHIWYHNYNETERVIAMLKGLMIHEYRRH